jgi:uncharacterized membrane-anchored protein YjiN (DUF445 family)
MSLHKLCIQNMVEQIKNLPPLLKEEIIEASLKEIKKDIKKEVMREIRDSASIVVEDITERLITSQKTGQDWKRPEYTKDIDDDLYHTFVHTAESFVNKYSDKLVFDEEYHNHQHAFIFHGEDYGEDHSDADDSYF